MSLFDDITEKNHYTFSTNTFSSNPFISLEDDHSDTDDSSDSSSDNFQMYSEGNDSGSGETETELLDEGKEEVDQAQEEVDEAQEKVDEMTEEAEKSQDALVATEALFENVLAAKMLGGLSAPHCELVAEHIRYIGDVIGMPRTMQPTIDVSLEAFSTPASVELSTEGVMASIKSLFVKIWNAIKWVFSKIWGAIKAVVSKIAGWTKAFFSWIYRSISNIFTKLKNVGEGKVGSATVKEKLGEGVLAKPFPGIAELLKSNEALFDLFTKFLQANLNTILKVMPTLKEYTEGVKDLIEAKDSGVSKISKVNLKPMEIIYSNFESFLKQLKGRQGCILGNKGEDFALFVGSKVIEFNFSDKKNIVKENTPKKSDFKTTKEADGIEVVKKLSDVINKCSEDYPLTSTLATVKISSSSASSLSKKYKISKEGKVGELGYKRDVKELVRLTTQFKSSVEAKEGIANSVQKLLGNIDNAFGDISESAKGVSVEELIGAFGPADDSDTKFKESKMYRVLLSFLNSLGYNIKEDTDKATAENSKVVKAVMSVINAINKNFLSAVNIVSKLIAAMRNVYTGMVSINAGLVDVFVDFLGEKNILTVNEYKKGGGSESSEEK